MRIFLNEIVNRSTVPCICRFNENRFYPLHLLCRKYSSTFDRVEKSTKAVLSAFAETRLKQWNQMKQKYDQQVDSQLNHSIKVCISDGITKHVSAWKSTPHDIITQVDDKVANNAIVAKVNGILWDLKRPLETDCTLEFIQIDNAVGRKVFWHSSAHVLGEAMEMLYGGLLCTGPATENGFYYDMFTNGVAVILQILNFSIFFGKH